MNTRYNYVGLVLATLSCSGLVATDLVVKLHNHYKQPVYVELYENLNKMSWLDQDSVQPEWEWQSHVEANRSKTKQKKVNSPGVYQVSAYTKSRKKPLGKPYTFKLVKGDVGKTVSLEITRNGVTEIKNPLKNKSAQVKRVSYKEKMKARRAAFRNKAKKVERKQSLQYQQPRSFN